MPLINVVSSVAVSEEEKGQLMQELSRSVAEAMGKPEKFLMVMFSAGTGCMAGKLGDAVFVDVRGIGGFSPVINVSLSDLICGVIHKSLGVAGDCVYINFLDIPASDWGWNHSTFG